MDRLLNDEEISIANQIPPKEYGAPPGWWHRVSQNVSQAQDTKTLKAVGLILAEWGYRIDMEKGILLEVEDSA